MVLTLCASIVATDVKLIGRADVWVRAFVFYNFREQCEGAPQRRRDLHHSALGMPSTTWHTIFHAIALRI